MYLKLIFFSFFLEIVSHNDAKYCEAIKSGTYSLTPLEKKKGIRYCWVLMLSEWKSVDQIVMRKTWINADLRWKRSLSLFLFASPKIIALRCTLSTLWGRLMADTSHLCMFVNKLLCLFNQKKKTLTWFVLRLNLACIEWTDANRWFLKFLGNP